MGRIEVFSDGVIAIAITLLAVELPFDEVGRGGLAHALSSHWPSFAAYLARSDYAALDRRIVEENA